MKFIQGDALEVLSRWSDRVDAVHTSPPCQKYTHGNVANDTSDYPDLISAHRAALTELGLPWVMENVPRAPLLNPLVLCGTQFGMTTVDDGTTLHLRRHRHFESNVALTAPKPCNHPRGVQWAGAYGGARRDKVEARTVRKGGYVPPSRDVLSRLLGGTDWMSEHGMFQCVPPAFTEHIGKQLLRAA